MGHTISLTDISIVVAARNEEKTLALCVDSLLSAARGMAEIIVVDDGSTDSSRKILSKYGSKIKVIEEAGKGPGHARNLVVRQSTRRYIAFTDADASVAPDWLEKLAEGLNGKETQYVAIGGPQKIFGNASLKEKWIGQFLESISFVSDYIHTDQKIREVKHNPTCNVLYAKSALEAVGGFDENLWPTEDLDLDLTLQRRGFKVLFTPEAVVEHRRAETFCGLFKMMKRYGFAHAQLVKKRGMCQVIHWSWIGVVIGILSLILSPTLTLMGMLGFLMLAFLFRTKSISRAVLFSFLLPMILIVWNVGFFSGLLGQRRVAAQNA